MTEIQYCQCPTSTPYGMLCTRCGCYMRPRNEAERKQLDLEVQRRNDATEKVIEMLREQKGGRG